MNFACYVRDKDNEEKVYLGPTEKDYLEVPHKFP